MTPGPAAPCHCNKGTGPVGGHSPLAQVTARPQHRARGGGGVQPRLRSKAGTLREGSGRRRSDFFFLHDNPVLCNIARLTLSVVFLPQPIALMFLCSCARPDADIFYPRVNAAVSSFLLLLLSSLRCSVCRGDSTAPSRAPSLLDTSSEPPPGTSHLGFPRVTLCASPRSPLPLSPSFTAKPRELVNFCCTFLRSVPDPVVCFRSC